MRPLRTILAAVDFTPCSAVALRQAVRIGAFHGARVQVVHVIDTFVVAELEESLSPLQQNIREGLAADARSVWQKFAAAIPEAAGLEIDIRIEHRVMGILAKARDVATDLLVLGAYGEGRPDVGIGTIATACVRQSNSDVLLVRDTQPGRFENIVVAADFSETSIRAVERAAQIAESDQAELHVLHVFDPPWNRLHYMSPTPQATPQFIKQYTDGMVGRLKEFAGPALDPFPHIRARYELFDYKGHRSGIVEYAQNVGAQLLALGTRGRTNLRDVFMGSTAEKALVNSTCSILAVKPDNPR